jgi:hypothetical protein
MEIQGSDSARLLTAISEIPALSTALGLDLSEDLREPQGHLKRGPKVAASLANYNSVENRSARRAEF